MLSLKTLFRIVIAGLISFIILGIPANTQTIKQEKKMNQNDANESPIACNLNALDREQRQRHESIAIKRLAAGKSVASSGASGPGLEAQPQLESQ